MARERRAMSAQELAGLPAALTPQQVADGLGVSVKTIYRQAGTPRDPFGDRWIQVGAALRLPRWCLFEALGIHDPDMPGSAA